jgi:hypothetical protein
VSASVIQPTARILATGTLWGAIAGLLLAAVLGRFLGPVGALAGPLLSGGVVTWCLARKVAGNSRRAVLLSIAGSVTTLALIVFAALGVSPPNAW